MEFKRQHTAPVVLRGPKAEDVERLECLVLGQSKLGGDAIFSEDTLQQLLFQHPELLPIGEIEPAFGPLLALAREVPTPAGPIDILYASPDGYLTLVETKLWKNTEARRVVVAQILDYAKELARWSYEELDEAIRKVPERFRPKPVTQGGIGDILRASKVEFDEASFVDTVQRNLKASRFLLLIVGEGIREGVEVIAKYLQGFPGARFALGLVEMALYTGREHLGYPIYVQPRLLARTVQVERAVVEIKVQPAGAPDVTVTLPPAGEVPSGERRRTLTEEAFFEKLREAKGEDLMTFLRNLMGELRNLGLEPTWGTSAVSLRFSAGLHGEFTVVLFGPQGAVWLGWLDKARRVGYDPKVADTYLKAVCRLLGGKADPGGTGLLPPYPTIERLVPVKAAFLEEVEKFIQGIAASARMAQE